MRKEDWLHIGGYYTLYGLLTVGLCGMVITGDMFNLYVYLEVMSLSGYGLIAMGGKKSMLAAFRYMLIGTIGASLYLISVAYLYAMTGTLNMADLGERIMPYLSSPPFALAVACLFIGFGIKMALFPLHGWQPDAYNFAHPGSAAFIAGVMSKVPAYAIIRFFFYIFGVNNPIISTALTVLGILGIGGVLIGSIMALAQYDFRRMLAYSSVAQIGYIAIGLAIGNMYGFIGAVLHIINHAFMKSALFLVIGGIQYRFGEINLYRLGGLNKKMTLSTITVTLAALSMVGIPPTAGFFSKWYLMLGAYQGGQYFYIVILVISSLLNAVYFFRILEQMFVQHEASLTEINRHEGKLGLPPEMAIPILCAGIGILVLGFYSVDIVDDILKSGLPEVKATTQYKPEYSWNYEIGSHLTLWEGKLWADLAAFYMDTRDQQISQMAESGLGRVTINAGKSRSYGVEAALRTSLTNELSLNASYGYTYATFTDYVTKQKDSEGNLTDKSYNGKYVPFVPKHTLNIGGEYAITCNPRSIFDRVVFQANYNAAGRIYWTEQNNVSQSFYGTLNWRTNFMNIGGNAILIFGFGMGVSAESVRRLIASLVSATAIRSTSR